MLPLTLVAVYTCGLTASLADEPAADFVKRLRAAKYFDVAITYLDRIDEYPSVDADFRSAVDLEKAQTHIDAGVASRNPATRDEYFLQAEQSLIEFLKQSSHPRFSEARLQLGKLQMVRAAQLMNGDPNEQKRKAARESYLAAAKTFDAIVEDLRGKLKEIQGAKIDPATEPQKAAMRDQYRGEFLQGKINAAETRKLAARTFREPGKDGKELLEQALKAFTDLSENYDSYVQGALAMLYRGQVQQDLGMTDQALDSYIRMLEHPDADALRDGKFQATSGLIELWLNQTPPNVKSAIERGQGILDGTRPNERRSPSVQELRIELAKAYLEKAKDTENLKPAEIKRAESSGRQLLLAASKVPGEFVEEAKDLLKGLGIRDDEVAELPTAEDPDDLSDAVAKARELMDVLGNTTQSLEELEKLGGQKPEIAKLKTEYTEQLKKTRSIAIQILRRGLAMVNQDTDLEILNQARQILAYLLYEQSNYRDAAVVGTFLAKNSPGTEMGLNGGVVALNAVQLLLSEVPDYENDGLIAQLEDLGTYMTKTWPDEPSASAAKGVIIRLALSKGRWADAIALVDALPAGPEQGMFRRLMGQLQWNESIKATKVGDDALHRQSLEKARDFLQPGLDSIEVDIVEAEAMKAALILVKVYLKLGDTEKAFKTLDHERYGPAKLIDKQGPPDEKFASDLYATELQVVVQMMTASEEPDALLNRAADVMNKLRDSVKGEDKEKRLISIYVRLASEIRGQLDASQGQQKQKLIDAFEVVLNQIAETAKDKATLMWVGQTLMELGEAAMQEGQVKATGQAADLLRSAVATFTRLKEQHQDVPLTVDYILGKCYRLLGEYKKSIDTFEKLLLAKPVMLDAQIEAARAYEQWAAIVPPQFAGKAYEAALNGARPNPQNPGRHKETIWGWGYISQKTSGNPQYRDKFFEARYRVALCRYLLGKAIKSDRFKKQAIKDIHSVHGMYPDLGGKELHVKFDQLLKTVQKDVGEQVTGLPQAKVVN